MKELHLVVQLGDDVVEPFLHAFEELTDAYLWASGVTHWGYHVHEHTPPGGEIVGWQVTSEPSVRDFHDHDRAALYASRTGGTLSPIYAEEDAHAPI